MPTAPATRAYRSKIGRLPWAARNELNERLLDGVTGPAILSWLNALPENPGVNAQNLTDWRRTGYADWLNARERASHIRQYAETAAHIAEAAGGDPSAVGSRILAGKMLDMLEGLEAETASQVATALARLRKGETDAQKLALDRDRARIAQEALDLERDKFRRQTCEMFLKWHADRTATDIAAGSGTHEDKIAALLAYMDRQEQV